MTEIQIFDVEGHGWRFGQDVNGTPWAVAVDVARSFDHSNTTVMLRMLDEDEKGLREVYTPGGRQDVNVVLEDGIWELVFRSTKPEAKAIKKRVKAILRQIRETGSFGAPAAAELSRRDLARMVIEEADRADAAEERAAALEPDAARARQTLDAHGLSLVGTVAKRFAIKERALREFLYAEKLLIRGGTRHNEPYARYVESGHFELKTRLVEIDPDRAPEERSTTYVTPKGEALIWKRLYAAGLVSSPTMPAEQLAIGGA